MKKTILILLTIFLLCGCKTTENFNAINNTPTATQESEVIESPAPTPVLSNKEEPASNAKPIQKEEVKKEIPIPTQKVDEQEKKQPTCNLFIKCDTILKNLERFDQSKVELLPKDGMILNAENIPFEEGESVLDILKRVTREYKIHLETAKSVVGGNTYIEGINNIYEFDCGELSGWMYQVNEKFPQIGASSYKVQNQDQINWIYSCEAGKDISAGTLEGKNN